jgi:biotin carboxylase
VVERWLVAIGAGRWQLSGIRAAQEDGNRVFAIDGDENAPGLRIADRSAVVDISSVEAVVNAVSASGVKPSGSISFVSDAGMAAAAAVREKFDLPGPRKELVERLTNKCSQRKVWTAAGLPCPEWSCVRDEIQAVDGIGKLGQKLILKPADSAGSRGVAVIGPGEEWKPAFAEALRHSRCGRVIVENFVDGIEYAVETFSHRGKTAVLAVSEKRKVPGSRGTVAIELATPSQPIEVTDRIGCLAKDAIAALGYSDGPGHTEILREVDGSLWLVETAGRGGGFMVADGLVPRASGYDLNRACARQALGLEPLPLPGCSPRAFVLRFLPAKPGIVTALTGFDRVRDFANVECEPLVKVGDRVERAVTDSARLAYILSWADDRATALSQADRTEACIRVDVAEEPQ